MAEERLQKVMAEAGVASRRKSEKLIAEGHVKVNGRVVKELGTKVEQHDRIEVDEVPIQREQNVYFLLNKPRGVITSVSDDKNRKTVMDFFQTLPNGFIPWGGWTTTLLAQF